MVTFKTGFDIKDYTDILPPLPDDNEILNADKDDPDDQFWKKLPFPGIVTPDFIYQEAKRIKQGVWIFVKGMPVWIPGNYYFFLQYWNAAGRPPQFRLKRLKAVYKKIRVRNNARYLGTFVIKNRKDGETLFSVSDGIWEVLIEEQKHGAIAMQSKTRDTVEGSCWKSLISGWQGLPLFCKEHFFADFTSGKNIAEQLKFQRPANPADPNDMGKNVNIVYGPCVYNAFDAYADIIRLILDEVAKWVECSFYTAFTNYKKIIMPGSERKGLFDIMTSPADTNGKHSDEAQTLWNLSDPTKINPETGSTYSRLLQIYSNPLDGIEGFYDKFGDCDPQQILEHILRERKATPKDQLMGEIRAFPLPITGTDQPNEEELFGATDTISTWLNISGIKGRSAFVKSQKEKVVYGNLEWPLQTPDYGIPEFRPFDGDRFDDVDGRFCFATLNLPRGKLDDLRVPPHTSEIEGCIGGDPFGSVNHTRDKKKQSMGAAVDWRFRDLSKSGWEQAPTGIYLARPWHKSLYHEDMIKFCLYSRSLMQYENSDGGELHDHFLTRGYQDWMLDSRDKKMIETPYGLIPRKGDAGSGRGATSFLTEIINAIDGVTNLPINKDFKYLLEQFWFAELLDDIANFNKDNTLYNHLTMALGQALIGRNKIVFSKQKKRMNINNQMIERLLG